MRKSGLEIWGATVLIIVAGLAALYSASFDNVRVSRAVFVNQAFSAAVALVLLAAASRMDYRRFYDAAYPLYGVTVGLLLWVLLMGRHALGAQRWLVIAGISFQPSELAKLALILALARYFSDRRAGALFHGRRMGLWGGLILPGILTLVPMALIFKQPDLGTALLCFGIFVVMTFISGLAWKRLAGFGGVCLAAMPFAWHVLKPYQKDRLLVFLNPNIDPLGAGYTIIQSKIAVGSGGLFGKGWLAGTQNQLNFLPERHTDFIFSVIGEEWGLLGACFLLLCYGVLLTGGLRIAERVKDPFGLYVAVGIVGILGLQVVINIGMVLGLCPVVGLTLPLVSYGRTSFFVSVVMIGFLLSLSRRRRVF